MNPEEAAREYIDDLLAKAGWNVQKADFPDLFSHRGVAIAEPHLKTGYADYLLVVDRKVIGVIEAKKPGYTLSGVVHQAQQYGVGLQDHMQAWLREQPLPFSYVSTGVETMFRNNLDPVPRSRRVFAFHRPETLAEWVEEYHAGNSTLRGRLQAMPDQQPLIEAGLWPPQVRAIRNLEQSLAQNRPRALIPMATGSGKTFTAVSAVYRLVRHAGAARVLFLVDRRNLGTQALKEFQSYTTPDDGRKFTELYNVQHMASIRLVIRTFRHRLFTEIFPGRSHVPKTLIFAKDDNHAEEIVKIVRQEFGQGDDFCQKVTYRVTGKKPEDIISDFRNRYYPRIAVTVDMIATGTDVRPIEILLFMRTVKSLGYFEQMRGRGVRVIKDEDLQLVSNDATVKDRFVIVDAVGVTLRDKVDTTNSLNRRPHIPLPKLFQQLAYNPKVIAALDLSEDSEPLQDWTEAELGQKAAKLQIQAVRTLQPLFELLAGIYERSIVTYDEVSRDTLLLAEFDPEATYRAGHTIESFRQYIEDHKDEITALRIIYNRPYQQQPLTFTMVEELAEKLKEPPHHWTTAELWRAYRQLQKDSVRGAPAERRLADLVALVRHVVQPAGDPLIPFQELVQQRYQEWQAEQEAAGRTFTPQQRWWLDHIAEHIGVNLAITARDVDSGDFFCRDGRFAALRELGPEWQELLEEMNGVLAVP